MKPIHHITPATPSALTDAVPKASREGYVCVWGSADGVLWQEALWLEFLGVGEVAGVPVEGVGQDDGVGSFGHLEAVCRQRHSWKIGVTLKMAASSDSLWHVFIYYQITIQSLMMK